MEQQFKDIGTATTPQRWRYIGDFLLVHIRRSPGPIGATRRLWEFVPKATLFGVFSNPSIPNTVAERREVLDAAAAIGQIWLRLAVVQIWIIPLLMKA